MCVCAVCVRVQQRVGKTRGSEERYGELEYHCEKMLHACMHAPES